MTTMVRVKVISESLQQSWPGGCGAHLLCARRTLFWRLYEKYEKGAPRVHPGCTFLIENCFCCQPRWEMGVYVRKPYCQKANDSKSSDPLAGLWFDLSFGLYVPFYTFLREKVHPGCAPWGHLFECWKRCTQGHPRSTFFIFFMKSSKKRAACAE